MRITGFQTATRARNAVIPMKKGSKFYGDIAERLRIILTETLQLMAHNAPESEVKKDGND